MIERKIGPFTFECECVSTGTEFVAEVDVDKRRIFSDFSFPEQHPHACRFLRPDGDLIRCTIHRDSPAQCKFYRCRVMQVFDPSGSLLGYVTGTLNLHSEDRELRAAWEEMRLARPKDEAEAEPWIAETLTKRGYRVT